MCREYSIGTSIDAESNSRFPVDMIDTLFFNSVNIMRKYEIKKWVQYTKLYVHVNDKCFTFYVYPHLINWSCYPPLASGRLSDEDMECITDFLQRPISEDCLIKERETDAKL